jgi:hypothetical protein
VSRVREPLAPARALLGRFHCGRSCCPLWATVSTRRLKAVNPDSAVELGKRKAARGRSVILHRIYEPEHSPCQGLQANPSPHVANGYSENAGDVTGE